MNIKEYLTPQLFATTILGIISIMIMQKMLELQFQKQMHDCNIVGKYNYIDNATRNKAMEYCENFLSKHSK